MAFFVPPLSSRGLGHQVLILVTRVRIPLGVPLFEFRLPLEEFFKGVFKPSCM